MNQPSAKLLRRWIQSHKQQRKPGHHMQTSILQQIIMFDLAIIDEFEQTPQNLDFDQLPLIEELDNAIYSIATLAAPGESGISLNVLEWP
jgi:hypothetical protein